MGSTKMWLFTGRYAQFGAAILAVALGTATIGVVFIVLATRLVRRSDVSGARAAAVILAVTAAATFSEAKAFGEPVFVANGLNRGAALWFAIVGISLGAVGVFVSRKRRLLGVLLLVAASGVLFGDVVGWVRRSRGPAYRAGAHTLFPSGAATQSPLRDSGWPPIEWTARHSLLPNSACRRAGPCRMMARG